MLSSAPEPAPQPEILRRRARGWHLLAGIAARGFAPDLLPAARAVPAFAESLPTPYDADGAAALHYEVFDLGVLPFQPLYLEGDAAGSDMARLRPFLVTAGLELSQRDDSGALASELELLARLCLAEAAAVAEGRSVGSLRTRQAQLLAGHLLRWLPPLCEAVDAQDQPLYQAFGGLLIEFAADHAAALDLQAGEWSLATPPAILADATTRLDDVCAYLLTPPWCGHLLDRRSIRAAAQSAALPCPFGDRRVMLGGLLRAGAEYDALPVLLDALAARTRRAAAWYAALLEEFPLLSAWIAPWLRRAEAHTGFLGEAAAALPA